MKKLMALLLAVIFVAVLVPFQASAAREMTESEKALIAKLEEKIKAGKDEWALPVEMVNQAKNYLNTHDALTDAQCSEIVGYVNDAQDVVKAQNTGDSSQWSKEAKDQILDDVDKAANVLNYSATVDPQNPEKGITIRDENGEEIVSNNVLKKTGVSVQGIVIASVGAVALLAACAVVSKKVDLF